MSIQYALLVAIAMICFFAGLWLIFGGKFSGPEIKKRAQWIMFVAILLGLLTIVTVVVMSIRTHGYRNNPEYIGRGVEDGN